MATQHMSTIPTAGPAVTLDRGCRYLTRLEDMPHPFAQSELDRLSAVTRCFPFRATDRYLTLVDWTDPADPIRRLVVPHEDELDGWGSLDASAECDYTVAPGVQHKYPSTVLFLCSRACGGACRYCFRKRLFNSERAEAPFDLDAGLDYVAEHPNVSNVLLTGGDALMLSTQRLGRIIDGLSRIPHVRVIRLGSKMLAFNPDRVRFDEELLAMFAQHDGRGPRLQLMAHFDHPREITPQAVAALRLLRDAGVTAVNQCPIVRGINDDPRTLRELFLELMFVGCPQYYVFQGRPVAGNRRYITPIVRSHELYSQAIGEIPGLAKASRLVMSHRTGKIEIVAVDERYIYLRYHRAFATADHGRFIVCRRDDEALWLDDLEEVDGAHLAA